MSDILKSTGMSVPVISSTLFTVPTSTTVIVLSGTIYNSTESSMDLSLTIIKSESDPVTLVTDLPIASKGSYTFPAKLILEPGDILTGVCSATGSLLSLNYVEHGDVYVDALSVHTDAVAIVGYVELAGVSATAASVSADEAEASAVSAASDSASISGDALSASNSAAAALLSEQSATSDAATALINKDAAAISATNASNSETAAASSASTASTDATSASTDAGIATTKAGEANASAIAAAASANEASTGVTKESIETVLTGELTSHSHALPLHDDLTGSGTNTHAQIDTFLGGTFAPSDAEAHIAPTKAEIEGVLTGEILTHTHDSYTETEADTLLAAKVLVNEVSPGLGGNLLGNGYSLIDSTIAVDLSGSIAVAQDLDLATANILQIAPTADITITFSNPPASGKATVWFVEMTGAGDYTMTWPTSVAWDNAIEPSWASGTDTSIAQFYTRDGGTTNYGRILMEVV